MPNKQRININYITKWNLSCCSDIDGVIKSANATEFGLASGVMTNNLSKALEVCKYNYVAIIEVHNDGQCHCCIYPLHIDQILLDINLLSSIINPIQAQNVFLYHKIQKLQYTCRFIC